MTGPAANNPGVEPAHEVRRSAAAWVQRQNFWDWSETDQTELDRWLAQSASHQVAYMRAKAVWNRTGRLTALRRAPVMAESSESRFTWTFLFRSAAAIALVCVMGLVGARYFQIRGQTVWRTPVGGREILTLGDGSKIELNTDTVLRVAADQRTAWLDRGEAFFQIKHDANHPFAVTVAGKRVVDLGTKFLVRYDTDDLEVALLEGRARIEPVKSQTIVRSAILTPGDVALATADTLSVVRVPVHNIENELSWRRNLLIFNNATLADVAAELNRYNREKLVIADPQIARLKIVASIPTTGVQAFKRVAKNFLGLQVEDRGDEILISR
jgi:transmembrane sensor